MGKSLGFRTLYPKYPFQIATYEDVQVRLGTREFYVDVPWKAYALFLECFSELNSCVDLDQARGKFLEFKRKGLSFNNLCKIDLRKHPAGDNLRLLVNWYRFLEHLEQVSLKYLEEVKRAGINKVGEIVRDLYRGIWENPCQLLNHMKPRKPPYNYLLLKDCTYFLKFMIDFKKLLRRTGDLDDVVKLLEELKDIFKEHLDPALGALEQKEAIAIRFYTTNLIMDTYHLIILAQRAINIPAAYMLLRNILEFLSRLYICLACLREKKSDKKRDALLISLEETVRKETLLKISKRLGLGDSLARLYSVCSEIIHRQPPLPFYSILEYKFFKNFLKEYIETVRKFVERMINTPIKIQNSGTKGLDAGKLEMEQKAIEITNELLAKYSDNMIVFLKNIISMMNELDLRALEILKFIFSITVPSLKKLEEGLFIEDDLYDVAEELELLSVGLERGIVSRSLKTLNQLKEQVARWIKEKGLVNGSDGLRMKVAFYVLAMTLPRISLLEKH